MADFYASSSGSPGGAGTLGDPWDLDTAFANTATIGGGDTLYLMEQEYSGTFDISLAGDSDGSRVVIRPYDEYVVIDCVGSSHASEDYGITLLAGAEYVDLWDIWVKSSNEDRWKEQEAGGFDIIGDHIRLFFCGAFDTGNNGIGWFSSAEGGLLHGCTIFNNGWDDTDRGHGHGVYTQNNAGSADKTLDLNVIGFNMGGQCIQAYTQSGQIDGYLIKRNVTVDRLLVGGYQPVDNVEIDENHILGGSLQVGFSAGVTNEQATVTDNLTPGGAVAQAGTWNNLTISGTVDNGSRNAVDILASEHDDDRAVIVVYDASHSGSVDIELTGLSLTTGREYVLAHHLNPMGQGYTFTWDGSSVVTVRTDAAWIVANPNGHDGADAGSQAPVPLGDDPPRRMAFILAPSARWPATIFEPAQSAAPSEGAVSASTPTLDQFCRVWGVPAGRNALGDMVDQTGNGHDLELPSNYGVAAMGDPDLLVDDDGAYWDFTGGEASVAGVVDGLITGADPALAPTHTDICMLAIVKFKGAGGNSDETILQMGNGGNQSMCLKGITSASGSKIQAISARHPAPAVAAEKALVVDEVRDGSDTLYMIAGLWDSSLLQMKLIVNGVVEETVADQPTADPSPVASTWPLTVGAAWTSGANAFRGGAIQLYGLAWATKLPTEAQIVTMFKELRAANTPLRIRRSRLMGVRIGVGL